MRCEAGMHTCAFGHCCIAIHKTYPALLHAYTHTFTPVFYGTNRKNAWCPSRTTKRRSNRTCTCAQSPHSHVLHMCSSPLLNSPRTQALCWRKRVRSWAVQVRFWAVQVTSWAVQVRFWAVQIRFWAVQITSWAVQVRFWAVHVRDSTGTGMSTKTHEASNLFSSPSPAASSQLRYPPK